MQDAMAPDEISDDATVEELRRTAARAEQLFEINVQLSATRDFDTLLRYIIETATGVLDCEAASVLLYSEQTGQLRFVAATGANAEELADVPVPLDDSLAGTIFTQDRPLVVGDVAQDARHYAPVSQEVSFDARSLVGVPLRLEGQPLGVLEGMNKRSGGFTDADVRTLSILAAQAAVAIRNAGQIQELKEVNDRLSRLDQLKSDFLALASHELRTPLTTILGFGEVLREKADGSLKEPTGMILRAARRMNEVVEAMTHMEKLRSGEAQIDARPVALQHALRRACNDAQLAAPGRLSLDMPEEDLTVRADPERLGIVFTNLIENALQFSPEDTTVTVRATGRRGDAHITVRDEGVGLEESETERIFEDFYQVEDTLTRTHGGLGLGLTVARELARLHGGRLHAESDGAGEGTTMHLFLPLAGKNSTAFDSRARPR